MKKLLFAAVLAVCAGLNAHNEQTIKAVLAAVTNKYSQELSLKSKKIKTGAVKEAVLCEVPFFSYKQNRAEFIFNKPYLPELALKLVFKDGRVFGIWRDERGFVGAFDQSKDVRYEEAVPQKLLSLPTNSTLIRLALLVDAQGKVSLQSMGS